MVGRDRKPLNRHARGRRHRVDEDHAGPRARAAAAKAEADVEQPGLGTCQRVEAADVQHVGRRAEKVDVVLVADAVDNDAARARASAAA